MIGFILLLALSGLIVGALGRLAIPGPNPMSIGETILVGLAGSFVGGLIGRVILGRPGGIVLAVLCTAGIVYFMQRREAAS